MPLNPSLFAALQHRFGDVHIVNDNEPREVVQSQDPFRPGTWLTSVISCGEQYAVNCPFCRDQRRRLYVSYQYGECDPRTGAVNRHLFYCHNEQCHTSARNREMFQHMLVFRQSHRTAPIATPAAAQSPVAIRAAPSLPDNLLPLDALEAWPASQYLVARGFDPAELSRTWNVSYCPRCTTCRPQITARIVIPIYQLPAESVVGNDSAAALAGWQARTVNMMRDDTAPKYLSAAGMAKSQLLYGLPLALQTTGPVWICEGVTDCWRVGPGAVALFGKAASLQQQQMIARYFAGRPLCVLLDRDAQRDAEQLQRLLARARAPAGQVSPIVVVRMPEGRSDPGECTRQEILDASAESLNTFTTTTHGA